MATQPSKELQVVANPRPGRDYEVRCVSPEFTCLCPLTGQPDFATVTLPYVPGPSIVDSSRSSSICGATGMKAGSTRRDQSDPR